MLFTCFPFYYGIYVTCWYSKPADKVIADMMDQESVKHSLYENGYGLTVVEVGQLNYGGILRRSISSPHG